MRTIVFGENDAGRRVDAFLFRLLPTAPKSLIYKYIRTGKIKIDGKKPKPEDRVLKGSELRYFGDESLLVAKPLEEKKTGDVVVLYENEHIALLYKPTQLASQPDERHRTDTLVDRFVAYLRKTGAYQPEKEHGFTPAICNRLDFNTSGIVIGAKTLSALRAMNEQIRKGTVRKLYICRVAGTPNPPEGTIRASLFKDTKTNISRTCDDGKKAETRYETLESDGKTSLLEVELFSGRSHQIRVHMQSIGHPLLGDAKYGKGGGGQALCAYKIHFAFPKEGVLSEIAGRTFCLPPAYLPKWKGETNA